jgi:hypothetical protein
LQYVKKSTFNSLTADKNEYDKSCNMRCLFWCEYDEWNNAEYNK